MSRFTREMAAREWQEAYDDGEREGRSSALGSWPIPLYKTGSYKWTTTLNKAYNWGFEEGQKQRRRELRDVCCDELDDDGIGNVRERK